MREVARVTCWLVVGMVESLHWPEGTCTVSDSTDTLLHGVVDMSTEKMVFNTRLMVDKLDVSFQHTHKNFRRIAAKQLADALIASGCLLVDTQYEITTERYHSAITVLFAKRERTLP